jgi:hypothetical protein
MPAFDNSPYKEKTVGDLNLPFDIDWSEWLTSAGGTTISTSTWSVEVGGGALTIDSESETSTVATVRVSAGTAGVVYTLKNTIVTASSITKVGRLYITVTA